MKNYFEKGTQYTVIPDNITNIASATLVDFNESELIFELTDKEVENITLKENTEFFTNVDNGLLYFISTIESHEGSFLKVAYPESTEVLQRRENDRISMNHKLIMKDVETFEKYEVLLKDLSIGGMKINVSSKIDIKKTYEVLFDFDNLNLVCNFMPLREDEEDGEISVSGQIKMQTPTQKIELVQYCYNKQFEQNNRN